MADSKKVSLVELTDFTYGTAEVGEQVDQYTKTTKAIGDTVGKTFGHEMKKLVLHEEESEPMEPTYPTNEKDSKAIAIWNKASSVGIKASGAGEAMRGQRAGRLLQEI